MTRISSRISDWKRTVMNALGAVPKEDHELMRERLGRQEQELQLNMQFYKSTRSRNQLYFSIEKECIRLKSLEKCAGGRQEAKQRLESLLDEYFLIPDTLMEIHVSRGSEGGTYQVQNFRIKQLPPEKIAFTNAVHDAYAPRHPLLFMFTDTVGPYLITENFIGERLWTFTEGNETLAPPEMIERHLEFTYSLRDTPLKTQFPPGSFKPESYRTKMLQNIACFIDKGVCRPSSHAVECLYEQAGQDEADANAPFFDRSLANAKYNSQGELKEFDFTKIGTLVLPCYEQVQIAYQQGTGISRLMEKMREKTGDGNGPFNAAWERCASNFLLRQMRHALNADNKFLFLKYKRQFLESRFQYHEGAALLVKELERATR